MGPPFFKGGRAPLSPASTTAVGRVGASRLAPRVGGVADMGTGMSGSSEAAGEALPNEESPTAASPPGPLPLRADEEAEAGVAERLPDGGAAALEAARFAYESTAEPVASIAKRLGINRWQLDQARRRGGWRMRGTGRPDRPARDSKADKIRELDRQLLSLTSGLAVKLEDRVQAEGATDATMRGLTGLLRAREAMVDSNRTNRGEKARDKKNKNNDGPAGHGGHGRPGHPAGADRAPELRAKIAERLDRLRDAQGPGETSR